MIKSICNKYATNITLNGEKSNVLTLGTRQECQLSPVLFNKGRSSSPRNTALEVPAGVVLGVVGEKAQIRKKKIKPFLYVDNMVVYIADPKESTQNFLEQRSESSKIAGYKINTKTNYMLLVNTWPPK